MKKKKLGRPKKVIDHPVEPIVEEEIPKPAIGAAVAVCECGEPAHPGSHQCWKCSHRS